MPRPGTGTYPPYFDNYVIQVKENDLFEAFRNQQELVDRFFDSIPEEKTTNGYAEGKWSLKELLQHIIDTERIFNYRALAFARREASSLPGFNENAYADHSNANARKWVDLCNELRAVRISTRLLYESFTEDMLNRPGSANNKQSTVLAMGFVSIGHVYHHKNIIVERYLA